MKNLYDFFNKRRSPEFTGNWYIALGATNITASLYTDTVAKMSIMLMIGTILVLWGVMVRRG